MPSNSTYQIGDVVIELGISADTLRYYEKIGLLKKVNRTQSGIRSYNDQDLSRLRFIQRAKTMNFTLDEISKLLRMRENPTGARKGVRELTRTKLIEVENHLKTLNTLRNELTLLINLCTGSKNGCPIIDDINQPKKHGHKK